MSDLKPSNFAFSSPSGSVPLRLTVVAPARGEILRDPYCIFEVVCTSRPVAKSRERAKGEDQEEEQEEETKATTATTTLGQALLDALPQLSGGREGGTDPERTPAWTLEPRSPSGGRDGLLLLLRGKSAKVLVAGLEAGAGYGPPVAAAAAAAATAATTASALLEAPVAWVHERLAACDQFLYVVVRAPEPL